MPSNLRILGLTPREWARWAFSFVVDTLEAAMATDKLVTLALALLLSAGLEALGVQVPYTPHHGLYGSALALLLAMMAFLFAEIVLELAWLHQALQTLSRLARGTGLAGSVVCTVMALWPAEHLPNVVVAAFFAILARFWMQTSRQRTRRVAGSTLFLESRSR